MNPDYARGRADERASVIRWLHAEAIAVNEQHRADAFADAAAALDAVAAGSEFDGLNIRPIEDPTR